MSLESSKKTNNPRIDFQDTLGSWLTDRSIEPDKAVLWPFEPGLANSLHEEASCDTIVGVSPHSSALIYQDLEGVQIAQTTSHRYPGSGFDLEYGWAVADDIVTALKPQIHSETNLHQYTYPDEQERNQALENAFSRLTDTTDRLLESEDASVLYNLESIGRYEMPQLDGDPAQNQVRYAERIAPYLEERGFETEIIEDLDFSRNTHVLGLR